MASQLMNQSDSRTLRTRQSAASARLDHVGGEAPAGAASILGQTTVVSSYPTTASSFYALVACDLNGAETEGAIATVVTDNAPTFYAWNAGTQIPPQGTAVVCHAVGGRWVFRYDA